MLNDATCFETVYIVTGYTDLRSGIDTLAAIIESKLGKKPFVPNTIYLFCGRKTEMEDDEQWCMQIVWRFAQTTTG